MSVSGICQICESQTAEFDCDRCGMLVCAAHFDEQQRICAECASETDPTSGGGPTHQL